MIDDKDDIDKPASPGPEPVEEAAPLEEKEPVETTEPVDETEPAEEAEPAEQADPVEDADPKTEFRENAESEDMDVATETPREQRWREFHENDVDSTGAEYVYEGDEEEVDDPMAEFKENAETEGLDVRTETPTETLEYDLAENDRDITGADYGDNDGDDDGGDRVS